MLTYLDLPVSNPMKTLDFLPTWAFLSAYSIACETFHDFQFLLCPFQLPLWPRWLCILESMMVFMRSTGGLTEWKSTAYAHLIGFFLPCVDIVYDLSVITSCLMISPILLRSCMSSFHGLLKIIIILNHAWRISDCFCNCRHVRNN